MDSDPAIRWHVVQDLLHEPDAVVAAERSKVATEGWGAQLLALQEADGQWGGGTYFPAWTSTTCSLSLLRDSGLDPASEQVAGRSPQCGRTASGSTKVRTTSPVKSSRASTEWPWQSAPISARTYRGSSTDSSESN